MFTQLKNINTRPLPFEAMTVKELWTEEHRARKMLECHLNPRVAAASRTAEFIERSAAWIGQRFHLDSRTSLGDLGCGPGLYARLFTLQGVDVTGVDFSSNSLAWARRAAAQEGLSINYIEGDYLKLDLSRTFDVIIMIYNDFGAIGPGARDALVKVFNTHLKPGGKLFLDVHTLPFYDEQKEEQVYEYNKPDNFWTPEENFLFTNVYKYEDKKVFLQKYTIITRKKTQEIFNWCQCFTLPGLEEELKRGGFEIEDIYSDVSGIPFDPSTVQMAVAAVKTREL